jgi:hypothetical protein
MRVLPGDGEPGSEGNRGGSMRRGRCGTHSLPAPHLAHTSTLFFLSNRFPLSLPFSAALLTSNTPQSITIQRARHAGGAVFYTPHFSSVIFSFFPVPSSLTRLVSPSVVFFTANSVALLLASSIALLFFPPSYSRTSRFGIFSNLLSLSSPPAASLSVVHGSNSTAAPSTAVSALHQHTSCPFPALPFFLPHPQRFIDLLSFRQPQQGRQGALQGNG